MDEILKYNQLLAGLQAQVRSLQEKLEEECHGRVQFDDEKDEMIRKVTDLRSRCSTLDRRLGEAESALTRERSMREDQSALGDERIRKLEADLRAANKRVEKLKEALAGTRNMTFRCKGG